MPMENIVAISIMVVGGALLAIIVSGICTNRKLRRHKECCRKEPHVPGSETNKSLRVEIERRVRRVGDIKYEPLLLRPDLPAPKHEQDQYYNRMKALDHLCYLERELSKLPGVSPRMQHESLRGFLLRLTLSAPNPVTGATGGGVLRGLEPRLLHQLCDQHSHARYHPQPFTRHHLTHTHALMLRVLHCGRSGGAKCLGSDDHLKGPSDHDSAIDADPLEMDAPSEDELERQQLKLPQQQYPQQPHRGQHHHQHYYFSSDGNSTPPTNVNATASTSNASSTVAGVVPISTKIAQQSLLSNSNNTGTVGGAGINTSSSSAITANSNINQGTNNITVGVNKTSSSVTTSHSAAVAKSSTSASGVNNTGISTTTATTSSATQKQGYHHPHLHSHHKQPGSAPPQQPPPPPPSSAAAALSEAVSGGSTPGGGGAVAAAGPSSAAAVGSSRREGKPRKAKKRPGHLRIQDEDEEY